MEGPTWSPSLVRPVPVIETYLMLSTGDPWARTPSKAPREKKTLLQICCTAHSAHYACTLGTEIHCLRTKPPLTV